MTAEVDLVKPSFLTVPSPRTTNYFPRAIWSTLTNSFYAYATVVSQYSKRAVTNPHDILNAVAGILNRWQLHYGHRGTICGLPAGMMDAALLWRCKGSYRRRRDPQTRRTIGYPSWSWAAWEDEIDFPHSGKPHDALLSMVAWDVDSERYDDNLAQWRKVLAPENPATADGPSENWKRVVTIQSIVDSLSINYVDTALPPNQANFAYPSRRNVEAATLYGSTRLDGILRFRARCCSFALTTEDVLAPPNTTVLPRDAGTLTVLDQDGRVAGAVQVPPPWVDTVTKEPQEFVALSRTTLTQDPGDPSWDETTQTFLRAAPRDREQVMHQGNLSRRLRDRLHGAEEPGTDTALWRLFDRQQYSALKFWPLYNVLLIRRNGDYAYRLGLGQIHVDALDPIAAEKLILLS